MYYYQNRLKVLTDNQKKTHKPYLGIVEYLDFLLKETKKVNPTIRNVATVAKIISENKYFETKSQLNKRLPKAMQYPTFNFILDYLQKTNMIQLNTDGSIVWIYPTSQKLKRRISQAKPL
ncbi:conserved hypothetical protein [Candidatus Nitrosotenuis uzonensis]|uniref:Uncharacterized protein n=1 Tax=Candidatus Nitrosotenuis uzonensis TaxID=1407055 RepID=V6AU40_9ARCH|nr:conserved hypothetical protein [Candidatus Nitrosotenuis uzonensis]CDI06050.1 hypothetical protein NITUZ_40216 [Candidatus Nitrosotenuis uzonensis]